MADVINSLKRLERVGTEASKTNQKLIAAAREIKEVIVAQFEHFRDGIAFTRGGNPRSQASSKPPYAFHYTIVNGDLINQQDKRPVSEDRTSALRFAEDIADGLLDVIEAKLSVSHQKSESALGILEGAAVKLRDKEETESRVDAEATQRILSGRKSSLPIDLESTLRPTLGHFKKQS